MQEDAASARPVGALVQSLRILRHLTGLGRPEGVSAVARATGVNPSTCFNILRTLAGEGLVVFDAADKSYRPGLGLVELAVGVLGANPGDLIRPEMERLALQYGMLFGLWHLSDAGRMVLIDHAFDPAATRVTIPQGKRLPVYVGGVGRALAAHRGLGRAALEAVYAPLRWQAAPGFEAYAASVEDARARGYAMDLGALYIGVDVIGAVITDAQGRARYGLSSVSLAGQTDAAARDTIGRDLVATCTHIGRALFAAPHTETS